MLSSSSSSSSAPSSFVFISGVVLLVIVRGPVDVDLLSVHGHVGSLVEECARLQAIG